MANVEMVGSSAVRRRAWSRSQRGGGRARLRSAKKRSNVAMESAFLTPAPSHAAAYSRRVVAPSSSLRRLLFSTRAAPAPLCRARAINPITNQSLTHQPCPSAPVHHVLSSTSQRSRRAPKRKWVWRLETCDGALLSWHRPTRLPVREGRLQTLEATLRPTLVLPLQPLTVLSVAGAATLCCR
jgi:hypothetical protein